MWVQVFKEVFDDPGTAQQRGNARRAIRRSKGGDVPDYWHTTGGAKNRVDLPAQGAPLVRRRHGSLEQRNTTAAPHAAPAGQCAGRFSYHEYR
eukprot:COSAG01_NODE_28986_length_648_cov_0.743169_1_plen_92_part_10